MCFFGTSIKKASFCIVLHQTAFVSLEIESDLFLLDCTALAFLAAPYNQQHTDKDGRQHPQQQRHAYVQKPCERHKFDLAELGPRLGKELFERTLVVARREILQHKQKRAVADAAEVHRRVLSNIDEKGIPHGDGIDLFVDYNINGAGCVFAEADAV